MYSWGCVDVIDYNLFIDIDLFIILVRMLKLFIGMYKIYVFFLLLSKIS